MNKLILSIIALLMFGCASFPPSSLSASFFGADVTIATPGWSAPVAVVTDPKVSTPVLLVPVGTAETGERATVPATAHSPAVQVPILEDPGISKPKLVLPSTHKPLAFTMPTHHPLDEARQRIS